MTDAVGIVRKRYKQPTATHVEALTGNFLDGEFDPPPSPPASYARGTKAASESSAANENQLSMLIRLPKRSPVSRQQRFIDINGEQISYTLQRSTRRRRTVQIQLDPESGLKVLVPHTLSDSEIDDFLLKRSDWILKHRTDIEASNDQFDWAKGGVMQLRGTPIQVMVEERDVNDAGRDLPPTVVKSLEGETVTVVIPPGMALEEKSNVVEKWMMEWYRQEAWDHLKARVADYGNVMGAQPSQLKLSNAKKRWGSCSGRRSINLNWRLIMLDERLIDYVVVHELAHLIELNHSPRFWDVVEQVLPDHAELRRQLRGQSPSALS